MPRHDRALLLLPLLLACFAGCDRDDAAAATDAAADGPAAAIVEADPTALARVRDLAPGERPDPRSAVLMDMRVDAKARTPDPSSRTAREVAAAIGGEASIIGSVDGAFTAPRAREALHLADGPGGERWIVLTGGDAPLRLRADGVRYLLASPDTDGSGGNEVLLRIDREQAGAVHTDLRLLAFDGGRVATVATFEDARVDACATASPSLRAERIEFGPAAAGSWPEFVVLASQSECVDGRAPDFAGYVAAERAVD